MKHQVGRGVDNIGGIRHAHAIAKEKGCSVLLLTRRQANILTDGMSTPKDCNGEIVGGVKLKVSHAFKSPLGYPREAHKVVRFTKRPKGNG